MAALSDYVKQTESFLRDRSNRLLNLDDITVYVNRARRDIALRTQCIRRVPPISGPITEIQVTDVGSGYTVPTVTITPPDFPTGQLPYPPGSQATAEAQQLVGGISNVSVTFGGDGYFQPAVTINDPTGVGAKAVAVTVPLMVTSLNQEIYNFVDFPLSQFPGVAAPFAILDVAMIFNGYRFAMRRYPFSAYQAYIRNYPRQYLYVPTIYSQFGQGAAGSLYMYPLPSQVYQFEADCLCLPMDLQDDGDYEALPDPWQDAVPYFAAQMCYLELQNFNSARAMIELYNERVRRYSDGARPRYMVGPYGRY